MTWVDGSTGLIGEVDAVNSLVGSSAGDEVGTSAPALPNGNFVVASPRWDEHYPSGAFFTDSGAVTRVDGTRGLVGPVTVGNSLLPNGTDYSRGGAFASMPDGDYAVAAGFVDSCTQLSGCVRDIGAWTLGSGARRLHGHIEPGNSLFGSVEDEGLSQSYAFDRATDRLVVGRPGANRVSLLDRSVFKDGFD